MWALDNMGAEAETQKHITLSSVVGVSASETTIKCSALLAANTECDIMVLERKEKIGSYLVEEFYWNGKYVVYVNNHKTEESFDTAVEGIKDMLDFNMGQQIMYGS